jgi:hypothetical protein
MRLLRDNTAVKLRAMILAMQDEGAMSTAELSVVLGYSISGARKYISRLLDVGIVRFEETVAGDQTMRAWIAAEDDRVQAYLSELNAVISKAIPPVIGVAKKAVMREAAGNFDIGTMVYELVDDLGMQRKRTNADVRVHRDELVAALFGAPTTRDVVIDVQAREVSA